MIAMKPEIKQRWLEALRSGNYKQTQGQLRSVANPDCYCCLGVLVNLYLQESKQDWILQAGLDEENPGDEHYACHNHYLGLPLEVLIWADLYDRCPVVIYDNECLSLPEVNDELGLSFEQIADIIDKQL